MREGLLNQWMCFRLLILFFNFLQWFFLHLNQRMRWHLEWPQHTKANYSGCEFGCIWPWKAGSPAEMDQAYEHYTSVPKFLEKSVHAIYSTYAIAHKHTIRNHGIMINNRCNNRIYYINLEISSVQKIFIYLVISLCGCIKQGRSYAKSVCRLTLRMSR